MLRGAKKPILGLGRSKGCKESLTKSGWAGVKTAGVTRTEMLWERGAEQVTGPGRADSPKQRAGAGVEGPAPQLAAYRGEGRGVALRACRALIWSQCWWFCQVASHFKFREPRVWEPCSVCMWWCSTWVCLLLVLASHVGELLKSLRASVSSSVKCVSIFLNWAVRLKQCTLGKVLGI